MLGAGRDSLCISRKVKKSESKSQLIAQSSHPDGCCVYPVKLKNLKANHNSWLKSSPTWSVVYIP